MTNLKKLLPRCYQNHKYIIKNERTVNSVSMKLSEEENFEMQIYKDGEKEE